MSVGNRFSYCNTRRWLINGASLAVLLVLLASMLFGCMGSLRYYQPLRTETPIKLFDQYEVSIGGYGSGSHLFFSCGVSFLTAVPEGSPIHDIPILIIDSVFFVGDCLNGPGRRRMLSWAELVEKYSVQNYTWRYGLPLSGKDLWVQNGVIVPGGFSMELGPPFSDKCYGPVISVDIEARLLDRAFHKEIARETKRVKFEIRRGPAG